MCGSVAPGLANCLRAARHRHRLEARQPVKAAVAAVQEFAAPDCVVLAPTQPVEHDAEHRPGVQRHVILRQAGGEMGVVVLHRDHRKRVLRGDCSAMFGGQVIRMVIDRDRARGVVEQRAILGERTAVVGEGGRVLQVADVVRQHRFAIAQQRKGALQLTAHGDQRGGRCEARRQGHRGRRIAAGTPQHPSGATHHAHDGIIHPSCNGAVVQQDMVRDAAQPRAGRVVVDALRFVGKVAAGHHQGPIDVAQQEVMQRGRWQHEAERSQPGGDAGQDGCRWRGRGSASSRKRCSGKARGGGGGLGRDRRGRGWSIVRSPHDGFQHDDRRGHAAKCRGVGVRHGGVAADHADIARH